MSIASLEEVVVWDDEGSIDGLQFDGRERRIQEWREKQEEKEFAALVNRLQKRNSMRRRMADPEKRKRILESQKRHRTSGKKAKRTKVRRRERYQADPVICECQECGAEWCVVYEKKSQKSSKFCSLKCRRRNHSVKKWQREKQHLRKMDARQEILGYLTEHGKCTSREVAVGLNGNLNSTRTLLSRMAKEGAIVSDGGKPALYFLASLTDPSA